MFKFKGCFTGNKEGFGTYQSLVGSMEKPPDDWATLIETFVKE